MMPFERKCYIHFLGNIYSLRKIDLLNSKALTKIQTIVLIAVIIVAAVGAGAAYVLLGGQTQSSDTIKIGVCADLDQPDGKSVCQGAVLAAEQVNAEGGVLGRDLEIVAEDDDSATSGDSSFASSAFTKLISVDEADFTISQYGSTYREIASNHKKILFILSEVTDELTQGVLDNYDTYKYLFRSGLGNETSAVNGITDSIVVCRNHTGFNKVAFLYHVFVGDLVSSIIDTLDEYGFDVVLSEGIPYDVIDFSSYFARAEEAGAEILYPLIFGDAAIYFVKEYYDRQSPMIMWGDLRKASTADFWDITEGKCEHITINGYPVVAGYPLTSKTVPTREAYLERWGEEITMSAAAAYDTVRFILPDAIKRAGTIETEAVIKALEETDVETSLARHFVFTSSHDMMVGQAGPNRPAEDYYLVALFQWQDGKMIPVYPVEIMEEAGASYTFPDWPGPWD
jgi:branched-chain amino acid transport system substrate-binding protein